MSLFSENKDLLRQIIISHYDNPMHKIASRIETNDYLSFHNKSASCIDNFEVFIKLNDNIIIDAKFFGIGCAISTASLDIMCELVRQKTVAEAQQLFAQYHAMIVHDHCDEEILDELVAFKDIYQQPNRIKCALIGVDCFEHILKVK